jgi:predicted enzyme involved in methoxymalonyl-ACP biosynthesis
LLSCRVLGRGVEDAFVAHVAWAASQHNALRLIGTYRPTAKNEQVSTFFPDRGFQSAGGDGEASRWELELEQSPLAPPPWINLGGSPTDEGHGG